jgi:CBS domain-containing protein
MTVSLILAAKGREVVTIAPTATIAAAIRLLAKKRIGAIVILGPGRGLVGLLSERDIICALAAGGKAVLDQRVSQTMVRNVRSCSEEDVVCDIVQQITNNKVRHIPVVNQSRVVGIVSIGDVVKHRLTEIERESFEMHDFIATAGAPSQF